MVKQSQSTTTASEVEDEWDAKLKLELTAENLKEWMFGYFNSQKQTLDKIRKKMIDEDGVPPDLAARCTHYEESPQEYVNRQKLKLCTNKKTGKLWDIPTMEAAGMISSAEIDGVKSTHGGLLPPYYFVGSLQRIVDDRVKPHRDYLTYNWIFEGIRWGNFEGQITGEAHFRINESGIRGYHIAPSTSNNVVRGKDGEDVRVTTFNQDATRLGDNIKNRIYDIPFNPAVVVALLRYSDNGQVSLGIVQLSTGRHFAVKSMEEFMIDDPMALIKTLESPQPTYKFDIDPKKFAEFLNKGKDTGENGDEPYQ